MSVQALLPIALLLPWLVTAQVSRADDPFDDLARKHETAQTQWQAAHQEFMKGLLNADTCNSNFRSSIVKLEAQMEEVFRQQTEYYAEWEKLIGNRVSREEANWQRIPAQAARLQKDADHAKAVATDARRRLRELTASGAGATDEVIAALRQVIETTDKEEQETRALVATLDDERKESTGQSQADRKMRNTLTARITSIRLEERLWKNLYEARLQRGRLQCKDGFR